MQHMEKQMISRDRDERIAELRGALNVCRNIMASIAERLAVLEETSLGEAADCAREGEFRGNISP